MSQVVHDILFPQQREVTVTESVLLEIGSERFRQEQTCVLKRQEGLNWHTCSENEGELSLADKLAVLTEEVGEVAKEVCDIRAEGATPEALLRLRTELIQTAAVAAAWAESL